MIGLTIPVFLLQRVFLFPHMSVFYLVTYEKRKIIFTRSSKEKTIYKQTRLSRPKYYSRYFDTNWIIIA